MALVTRVGGVYAAFSIGGVFDPNTDLSYSGTMSIIDDGNGHWRAKFLTSGMLTTTNAVRIDSFIVGGGQGGGCWNSTNGGAGGAGGFTRTDLNYEIAASTYEIVVGDGGSGSTNFFITAGGASSAFGKSVNAATVQNATYGGGNGGSGGCGSDTKASRSGGTNGGNGAAGGQYAGGIGQGSTTKEFAEVAGTLYSSGGSFVMNVQTGASKSANPGDGGNAGMGGNGGAGGSGIVVIRDAR